MCVKGRTFDDIHLLEGWPWVYVICCYFCVEFFWLTNQNLTRIYLNAVYDCFVGPSWRITCTSFTYWYTRRSTGFFSFNDCGCRYGVGLASPPTMVAFLVEPVKLVQRCASWYRALSLPWPAPLCSRESMIKDLSMTTFCGLATAFIVLNRMNETNVTRRSSVRTYGLQGLDGFPCFSVFHLRFSIISPCSILQICSKMTCYAALYCPVGINFSLLWLLQLR